VRIRRYVRRHLAQISYCYEKVLVGNASLAGTLSTTFVINENGTVSGATATGVDETVGACVADVLGRIEFPAARGGGVVQVNYPFHFRPAGTLEAEEEEQQPVAPAPAPEPNENDEDHGEPALEGKLARVERALRAKRVERAYEIAKPWHDGAPGDVLALIALGETLEAKQQTAAAARIYGSIIDLFPGRADMRRFAGERLERLGAPARALVVDTYRRAVADRPDHASGHRLLAYALLRSGDRAGAFSAILAGVDRQYRDDGVDRVLDEDAGMIAAAYLAHGGPKKEITAELSKRHLRLARKRSTRFVMYWETDANDVDFHIRDSRGGHAYYSDTELDSGGQLYADITTGYGPECFAIEGTPQAGPYRLSIHYYSKGPMGYGMGMLQIQRFDGNDFTFEERPYTIMNDHAFVDLGTYR
jgi:hypothetical protein